MKTSLLLLALAALCLTARADDTKTETAVLGAGCFWCVEAIYEQLPGVTNVVSGYAGGKEANPTYEQVGSGRTGHAEAVQVTFDPAKTSYEKLLEIFWKSHDATDPRGVRPDFGTQYRSIILTQGDEQAAVARKAKAEAQKKFQKPIVTEIAPLQRFWPAEAYHQDYVRKHPHDRYVESVSIPRLREVGLSAPK